MKKLLIFILTIGIFMSIGFIFFKTSTTENKISTNKNPIEKKENKQKINNQPIQAQETIKEIPSTDNKLNNEIKVLLKKAENFLQESKDDEAIKIYNLIIEKIADSSDPKLLKLFASACMSKGYIYQIYPNIDNDAAISAYTSILNKFNKSKNNELIQLYIDAKIQLTYLLPNDEKLEAYNDLLSKFENNIDINIQKRLESLLITKSFQLMGKNDEEAMSILDKVIEKYQDKDDMTNLPENIRFSILNNIELALITNNESDTYVELAEKFMSNSPDTKPLLDMLSIIKNSQDLNQDEALESWKEQHADYRFPDWSFQEMERWAYKIEDKETKERVTKYITAFVNQKYNIPDKYSNTDRYEDVPKNSNHSSTDNLPYPEDNVEETYNPSNEENILEDDDLRNNDIEEVYQNDIQEENNTKEEIYLDPYNDSEPNTYEPDPYAQDIYEATGAYPNPYE